MRDETAGARRTALLRILGLRLIAQRTVLAAPVWLLASYKGLPDVLTLMTGLIDVYAIGTRRTTLGRRIYGMGGNERAAQVSGVPT